MTEVMQKLIELSKIQKIAPHVVGHSLLLRAPALVVAAPETSALARRAMAMTRRVYGWSVPSREHRASRLQGYAVHPPSS